MQRLLPVEALRLTRASLGLDERTGDTRSLIAAALRRGAGIMCPCRPGELSRAVWNSLRPLDAGIAEILVEEVVDEMLMIGDLAEVKFTGDGGDVDRLCLMPFAFVRRAQGYITLLGGRPDEGTALPREIARRIVHRGAERHIAPVEGEDLPKLLTDFGLLEIEPHAWLRLPRLETAMAHIAAVRRTMPLASGGRRVDGLLVLGPGPNYSRRWCEPAELTGLYVARRPQAYGAPVWSAVQLSGGQVTSLVDLHAPGGRWRPCDVAWHLQAALDATAGAPQSFRRVDDADSGMTIVEFASPLPSWAERRLRLTGERISSNRSLISFAVPSWAASEECRFLQDYLWMREQRT